MKSTVAKLGILGIGLYVVSSMLKKTADAFPPRTGNTLQGYDHLMSGYNPLDEAIGCNCGGSFEDQGAAVGLTADGIGGFGSKLRKFAKAPVKLVAKDLKKVAKLQVGALKKVAAPVQKAVKHELKQVKRLAVTNPLNALKKSAQIVKRDLVTNPKRLFGHKSKSASDGGATKYFDANGNQITEAQYNALTAANSVSPETVYQDYDSNVITKDQYDALMAQQGQEYATDPDQSQGFDQSQVEEPDYSMDQVAADLFAQTEEGGGQDTDQAWIVAATDAASDDAGFTDGTFPLTGDGAADLYDTWDYDPGHGNYAGIDQDPYAPQQFPQDLRQNTMDAYASDQTSGDELIMPAGEPSMPFTGNEFAVMYESEDSPSRGAAWSPDPDGSQWGNVNYGGQQMPGYWQGYGGFDWNWEEDGLGALVSRPDAHGHQMPAHMVLSKPGSTYGYHLAPQAGGRVPTSMAHVAGFSHQDGPKPAPILADSKGNLYVTKGGSMHRIGSIDDLCDGNAGMGCASFGRDMGNGLSGGFKSFLKKLDPVAKKVASRITPSGFLYERLQKNPKVYKEYRKAVHTATPYALIVGGAVATVATVGIASPVGVAAIAGGVAELGAQGYSDYKTHEAEKEYDKTMDEIAEQDRLNEAISSGDVIQNSQGLTPSGGPAAGEIPGGDWPWEYPGDGVWADFLDLTDAMAT